MAITIFLESIFIMSTCGITWENLTLFKDQTCKNWSSRSQARNVCPHVVAYRHDFLDISSRLFQCSHCQVTAFGSVLLFLSLIKSIKVSKTPLLFMIHFVYFCDCEFVSTFFHRLWCSRTQNYRTVLKALMEFDHATYEGSSANSNICAQNAPSKSIRKTAHGIMIWTTKTPKKPSRL